MRVRIDRATEAVHLALADAPEARRAEVADNVVVAHGGGRADRRGGTARRRSGGVSRVHRRVGRPGGPARRRGRVRSACGPPRARATAEPYAGPLAWDPDAEAAMLQVPFFSRGRYRLAAIALARERGQDRVTLATVRAIGR